MTTARRDRIFALLATGPKTIPAMAQALDIEAKKLHEAMKIYVARGWVEKGGRVPSPSGLGRRTCQTFELGDARPDIAEQRRVAHRLQEDAPLVLRTPAAIADRGLVAEAIGQRTALEMAWGRAA